MLVLFFHKDCFIRKLRLGGMNGLIVKMDEGVDRWIDSIANCSTYKSQLEDIFPERMCGLLPKIVWSLLISLEVIYPLCEFSHG